MNVAQIWEAVLNVLYPKGTTIVVGIDMTVPAVLEEQRVFII